MAKTLKKVRSAHRAVTKRAKGKAAKAVKAAPVVEAPPDGLKDLKKSRGGARPGAGVPKGYKQQKTIDKEAARTALRQIVIEHLRPLVKAQLDNAMGISHFMLRDPKSGKFERVTSESRILEALNADEAEEGTSYHYIYTKDPSVQAFTDLMNRTIDKPVDAVEMTHSGGMTIVHELPTE